jgi:hypothetical protein
LASFPPFPPPPAAARPVWPRSNWTWECALIIALTLAALISRTWALTELYDFLDLETIEWIVQGRTWNGYLGYLDYGFVQNNGGAVQLLPTQVIFRLFGTSVFTLRMTSVLWSIAAVPLMYALGRRIGGVTAGTLASIFLITAPEQLFWARNENLHFAPIAICALVTAHLTLWLVERLSPLAVLVTALWMPWCRWFYSASMVAFLVPIVTALHAMIFGRSLWRKAWYVVPGIALGLVFWIFSLSVMRAALHDWNWQFVDPAAIYGASAWRKHGEFRDASLTDLIGLQAVSISKNFGEIVRNMSYQTETFSHWCQRSQPPDHRTIMNVGLALLVFVGVGYLLGQAYERRAFLLVACWGIALIPALLSTEPADRRMAMMFPYSHVLAGATLAAFLAIARERGGRLAEGLATLTTALGLAAIALTNLASHLQLPINPILFSDYPRIARPLLTQSDAMFTNLPSPFRTFSVFGNLDHFLAAPTCVQYVEPHRWLSTALNPTCAFNDPVYWLTIGEAAAKRLQQSFQPKRVSYLLMDDPSSAPYIAMLRALHPRTPVQRYPIARAERAVVAMTVDAKHIDRLRAPTVAGDAGNRAEPILSGVPLRPLRRPNAAEAGVTKIEGGILLDSDGWYRWRIDPPCPAAALQLDGRPVSASDAQPMLAGVHPFTLRLPTEHGCTLPLRIVREEPDPARREALEADRFTSPGVAALPEVRAVAADAFEGYGGLQPVVRFPGRPVDFGVDAQGNISVLMREGEHHRVRRYDRAGKELAVWALHPPLTINPGSIAVAPDGTTAVLMQRTIHFFDPTGKPIGSWEHPWLVWESQLEFWGDRVIANIYHRDSLAVYTRDGQVVREFKEFRGGPGKLYSPMGFSLDADGNLLVVQLDGQALRFRVDRDFNPVFVDHFRTDSNTQGSGFDRDGRVLATSERGLRAFGPGGRRLMASDPRRDVSKLPLSPSVRVRRDGERLMVLDSDGQTLWMIRG